MKPNFTHLQHYLTKSLRLFILTGFAVLAALSTTRAQFGASPWTAPSGTYTVPAGVTSITVTAYGGGGGGGGCRYLTFTDDEGGGGGGGACSVTTITVVPGSSIVVAVGAGGTAGSSSGGNGGAGGTSSVTISGSVVASAAGGGGGMGSNNTGIAGAGGAGGAAGTGVVHTGGNGGSGYLGGSDDDGGAGGGGGGTTANGTDGTTGSGGGATTPTGGAGGASGGGRGGNGGKSPASGSAGVAGSTYGGGGGGAATYNAGAAAGGAGAAGAVIITYNPCATPTSYTVTGGGSYCSAGGTAPTVGLSGSTSGISYQLQLGGANVGSPVAGTGSAITFGQQATAGTYTVVTSGYCAVYSMTGSVTVSVYSTAPSAPGSIIGPTTVCPNSANIFSAASSVGAQTYTWSLPGTWTGSSMGDSITATSDVTAGTVSVTANNACGSSAAQTLAVSIGSTPATPAAISGTAAVCSSVPDTFSIATVSGATSYTWSLPVGWTGSSTTNSIISTSGTMGGTVSVTANNSCGSSPAQTFAVTITSPPAQPPVIFARATECAGALDTFAVNTVSGATSYTWSLPVGWTGIGGTLQATTAFVSSSGTISVTANGACGSSAAQTFTVSVVSAPATPGVITGAASVCSGGLDTFSITAVNGATTYTWSLPNGWAGTSSTTSITATSGAAGGTVSVNAGNSCGTSSAQTFAVSITAAPATPGAISGRASVCSGALDTFSVAAVSGATSYTWSLPNGWTGSSTTNSIVATAGSSGGNVSVTAHNNCGSSSAQTFTVTMASSPATPGAISGRASVCRAALDTFSIAAVSGAISYTWSLPNGWTGTSTSTSIIATAGSAGGTVSVTANSACGSSSPQVFTVAITPVPTTPVAILGRTIECAGALDTFAVNTVSGATSYTWSLPAGWSGSSSLQAITATAGSTGGTVSVTANNACGSSSAQIFTVSITTAPATPGAITGTASLCSGSRDTLSITAVNGATSYTWTLPNGWSGSSTFNSIIATTGSTGGTVTVKANNGCGTSAAQTFAVSINTPPASPAAISGTATICSGSRDTFTVAPVSGATSYTWTLPNGWTGTSNTASIIGTSGSTGAVMVTANNSCGSSSPHTLAVTVNTAPAAPASIIGHTTVCASSIDTFSVTPVTGATSYTWTLPNGWTGTSTTSSIISTAGVTGGNITVRANNSCGSSSAQTLAVSIAAGAPATPGAITGHANVCAGGRDTFSITAVSGATSYIWTLPNGWTGTSVTPAIITTPGNTGGVISVKAINGCGTSAASVRNDTVRTTVVTFNFGNNPVCSNSNPSVTLTATPSGGVFSGTGVTGSTFNATGLSSTNYILAYTYTNSYGCVSTDTANVSVKVCTGIEQTEADIISIYPNPFNETLVVNINGNYSGQVTLTDATGREVRKQDFATGTETISLSTGTLASGPYILNIYTDGKMIIARKVIKVD